jgi:hypothetical protein
MIFGCNEIEAGNYSERGERRNSEFYKRLIQSIPRNQVPVVQGSEVRGLSEDLHGVVHHRYVMTPPESVVVLVFCTNCVLATFCVFAASFYRSFVDVSAFYGLFYNSFVSKIDKLRKTS